jgi:anti-sigma B factor antagonist
MSGGNGWAAKTSAGAEPCVVRVEGELDIATAPEVRRELLGHITEGRERVVVDLSGTTFIDSSGLQSLIVARKRLDESGGSLLLSGCSDQLLRVLDVTGLREYFEIHGGPSGKAVAA